MEAELLNVAREEVAPCRLKLEVTIPAARVEAVFKEVEANFLERAKISGFRPGKAPKSLLWRQYGQRIEETAKDRLLRECADKAVQQAEVVPETMPVIEKEEELQVQRGQDFVFTVSCDTAPEFELPDYRGITVADEATEIGDDLVEDSVNRILRERTSYEKTERPARENDLLKASYKAVLDEAAKAELPESVNFVIANDEGWLALREPEILPGIRHSLLGIKPGESREITVEFPDDFFLGSLAGRIIPYQVEVSEVHAPADLELTDEVARQMGAESAVEVKQQVRKNLEQREAQDKRHRQRGEITAALLEAVDFELPPLVLARQTYETFQELYQEQASRLSEKEMQEKQEELYREAEKKARQDLKRNYILSRIADAEGIKVSQEELVRVIEVFSRHHQTTARKLTRQLQESGRIVDLLDDVRAAKTLDHIISLLTGEGPAPAEAGDESPDRGGTEAGPGIDADGGGESPNP